MRGAFPLLLLVLALLAPGCVLTPKAYHTAPRVAPSAAAVKGDVAAAQAANGRAAAAADRLGAGVGTARGQAQRIEDKAVIVLRYLHEK